MDTVIEAVIKSYGLLGVIMLLPTAGFIVLGREYLKLVEKMRKQQAEHVVQIDALGQRVAAAQEKRVDDSHSITSQLVEMISEHTKAAEKTNLALDRIGDMVTSINYQNQVVVKRGA